MGCLWVVHGLCVGCAEALPGLFGAFLDEVIEISEIIINFIAVR